jgi:FixJ family two-component response regulator
MSRKDRATARRQNGAMPTVHIIEDDPAVRDAARELVAAAGRKVRTYGSPAEFFAAAPPDPRDIVVLDLQLPTAAGVEAAARLRRDHPGVRIVVISGVRTGPYLRAVAAIAPAASFRKPLDPLAFRNCLNELAAT